MNSKNKLFLMINNLPATLLKQKIFFYILMWVNGCQFWDKNSSTPHTTVCNVLMLLLCQIFPNDKPLRDQDAPTYLITMWISKSNSLQVEEGTGPLIDDESLFFSHLLGKFKCMNPICAAEFEPFSLSKYLKLDSIRRWHTPNTPRCIPTQQNEHRV